MNKSKTSLGTRTHKSNNQQELAEAREALLQESTELESTEKQREIAVWTNRLEGVTKELRSAYVKLSIRLIPILRNSTDENRQEEPMETQSPLGNQLEEIASNLRWLLRDLCALENNVEL